MPDNYLPRVVDSELDGLSLPAVILEGAKAVGKTRTLERRSETVHRLDVPVELELVRADENRLLSGSKPILIDEFQRFGPTIDVVRAAVDRDNSPRQFYLAGSASEDADTHSGAGRIVSIRMRPMAFSERQIEVPTVSLGELLEGGRPDLLGQTGFGLSEYTDEILRSGFPAIRDYSGTDLSRALLGYVDRVVQRDVLDELGRAVRQPDALRRWIRAYAAVCGTTASLEKIRNAASGGVGRTPTQLTTLTFRDVLEKLWIIDDLPAWLPILDHLGPLAQSAKRFLVDPGIAAVLVGVGREKLLSGEEIEPVVPREGSYLGTLFEALTSLSVRVYAQAAGAGTSHFRQQNGRREVDLIVERQDGAVVAIEVKLSKTVDDRDIVHLVWLKERLGEKLLDALVVCTSPYAYRRQDDGIGVVPLALLGP